MGHFKDISEQDYKNQQSVQQYIHAIDGTLEDAASTTSNLEEILRQERIRGNDSETDQLTYEAPAIVKIVQAYYKRLVDLAEVVKNKLSKNAELSTESSSFPLNLFEPILETLSKELPESLFNKINKTQKYQLDEHKLKTLLEKIRHVTLNRLYKKMIIVPTDPVQKIQVIISYSNYLSTIPKDDFSKSSYNGFFLLLDSVPKLEYPQLKSIVQTEGEDKVIAAFDSINKHFSDDTTQLPDLRKSYLNLYQISCENSKENTQLAEKICNFFDDAIKSNPADSIYKSYYETLNTITLASKNSEVRTKMLNRLETKNGRSPEMEKLRVQTLKSVCETLINNNKAHKNISEIGNWKKALNQLTPSQKQKSTNDQINVPLRSFEPFKNERKIEEVAAREAAAKEAVAKEAAAKEVAAKEAATKEAAVKEAVAKEAAAKEAAAKEAAAKEAAAETEKNALKEGKHQEVNGSILEKIKLKLTGSDKFKELEVYGNDHKIKQKQIQEYKNKINNAGNLAELHKTVKEYDPKVDGIKYSMRDTTSILKTHNTFRFFHDGGKSTTDKMARQLVNELNNIIEAETSKVSKSPTFTP